MEKKKLKICNLYCGIGGNRKLWGDEHEVVAIENNPKIAKVYQDFFPNDKVIVTDAHKFLLKHFKEFDFIWSSPPCPSHSRIRKHTSVGRGQSEPIFPDLKLYEEVIFLQHYFKGRWVVENVVAFYKPLITPKEVQRHWFWANFHISRIGWVSNDNIAKGVISFWEKKFGFEIDNKFEVDKRVVLRNCVEPKLGLHIFKMAFKDKQNTLL